MLPEARGQPSGGVVEPSEDEFWKAKQRFRLDAEPIRPVADER